MEFSPWKRYLTVILLCELSYILHIPFQIIPVARDQGVWLTAAAAMSQGLVFYKDFLHFHLPGTAIVYLAVTFFFENVSVGLAVVAGVCASLTVVAIYALCSRVYDGITALCAAFTFAVFWPTILNWWDILQKDYIGFICVLFGAVFATGISDNTRSGSLYAAASGCLIALATLVKPTFGVAGLLIEAILILQLWGAGNKEISYSARLLPIFRSSFILAMGFVVPWLGLVAYLYFGGALFDAYQSLFVVGPNYMLSYRAPLGAVLEGMVMYTLDYMPRFILLLAIIGAISAVWRFRNVRSLWFLVPLVTALMSVIFQGKCFRYHLHPLFIVILIGCGIGLSYVFKMFGNRHEKMTLILRMFLILFVCACFAHALVSGYTSSKYARVILPQWFSGESRSEFLYTQYAHSLNFPNPLLSEQLAKFLQAATQPEDKILIWGLECQIYALANRMYATQAPFHYMLTSKAAENAHDWVENQRKRFLSLLEIEKPKFIVITTRDGNPIQPTPSDKLVDKIRGFREYIESSYSKTGKAGRFLLYKRKGGIVTDEKQG